ncbi:hypothetical protein PG993_012496 [Apiospora rasikravindrae]|uniref:Heterokaryon incompatibility domain-containing protein n=1 Tax=Apiospora rasikravindrae TaxID=990691 RepID=A0ABR1S2R9_9PEZI
MKRDDEKPFGELYSDQTTFLSHLTALQSCISQRDSHHRWARQLRFVAVNGSQHNHMAPNATSTVSSRDQTHEISSSTGFTELMDDECACKDWLPFSHHEGQTLQVTESGCCPNCEHYVAVSYCWQTSDEAPDEPPSKYDMIRVGTCPPGKQHNEAPSTILRRAIAFAASREAPFIWVDQECILQQDRADKEDGIQSMDLVYQHSAWPLGLLNCVFDKQSHLNAWDSLIQGIEITSEEQMHSLKEVLQLLAGDRWFARAWILQESVSAGTSMTLLARHAPGLEKSEYLGTLEGEIEIDLERLFHGLIWARNCADTEPKLDKRLSEDVIDLVDNIWEFHPTYIARYNAIGGGSAASETDDGIDQDSSNPRMVCNAAQALHFLRMRKNSRIPDRLAIMANLCNYSVRLDTTRIEDLEERCSSSDERTETACGFSVCALALALFNGDYSLVLPKESDADDGGGRHDEMRVGGFCWGPTLDAVLCSLAYYEDDDLTVWTRSKPARIRSGGLSVRGWLWEVTQETCAFNLPLVNALRQEEGDPEVATIIWLAMKDLMRQGLVELAQVIWGCFTRTSFGDTLKETSDGMIPSDITDVLEVGTGNLVYHVEKGWVREKEVEDFEAFFFLNRKRETSTAGEKIPCSRISETSDWFFRGIYERGHIQAARLISTATRSQKAEVEEGIEECAADAPLSEAQHFGVFDLPWIRPSLSSSSLYIFTPATPLDEDLAPIRRSVVTSWIVEPVPHEQHGARYTKLRGVRSCRGFWKIPRDVVEPREYVLL